MGNIKTIPENTRQKFYENLSNLSEATPLLAESHKKKLLSTIDILTDSETGLRFIYENLEKLIEANLLKNTMWEDPSKLVPSLVGGTLKAGGQNTLIEIISELRMLAIANEDLKVKKLSSKKAQSFIEETLINNLDLIFPDASEQNRSLDIVLRRKIDTLFNFLTIEIPVRSIKDKLGKEVELICLQHPIVTDRALQIIKTIKEEIPLDSKSESDRHLQNFVDAVYAPSEKAGTLTVDEYRTWLNQATKKEVEAECKQLAASMRETGLAVKYHAVLLKHASSRSDWIKMALGLDNIGRAELDKHVPLVKEIIQKTIHPDTARSCFGLAKLLERSLLSHQPVKSGLKRIMDIELHDEVSAAIRKSQPESSLHPTQILAAECLGILGQPLGIGQGWNPTCQSARGISLWSSHAPGKLLRMIESAAKSNSLWMRFEGQEINSKDLVLGLAKQLDYNLDAVSVVLVPHLDKIYNEMMRRASNRADDPHKWVNPAMYGHWIPTGFISAYDSLTNSIKEYEKFVRTFYATHHPDYNGGHNLAYPNPVGIFLTSAAGKLIGFHAVSILRVKKIRGHVRVYMLNPNNEGRQRWQDNIKPTVAGNGEEPGESSLPFHQFTSRLYAFHYNQGDLDNLDKVNDSDIQKVKEIAKSSWGDSYQWTESPELTL